MALIPALGKMGRAMSGGLSGEACFAGRHAYLTGSLRMHCAYRASGFYCLSPNAWHHVRGRGAFARLTHVAVDAVVGMSLIGYL
jgi:hypothetical protein